MTPLVDVVVPTVGRDSLHPLVQRLASIDDPALGRVVVVDDRRRPVHPLRLDGVHVARSGGRGPAAARNAGWRRCTAPWVCFVDDDVVLPAAWFDALRRDLLAAPHDVAAVQGQLVVPLPSDRCPTDRERNVAALETADWITADMAVRRTVLVATGGFDERFPRAYREDTELALRIMDRGWRLRGGARTARHPVAPAPWWASVRAQRGNADDALVRRLHGPGWRERAGAPRGAHRRHAVSCCLLSAALAAGATRRARPAGALAAAWAVHGGWWTWRRIAPGPRDRAEIARMVATSLAIPPAAVAWACYGRLRASWIAPRRALDRWTARPPAVVLFDRDGTLVRDVPYNGDPGRVEPVEGALAAVRLLRRHGVATALVTNQSGIARGLLTRDQVDAVNARVDRLLGPFRPIEVCPHDDAAGCGCRKPAPGMVLAAARAHGVRAEDCAVVGDIGSDVEAAVAVGARAVLVPTPATLEAEVERAPEVARSLATAAFRLLHPDVTDRWARP